MKRSTAPVTPATTPPYADPALPPETICRHCHRPKANHGKMLGHCMGPGYVLRTTFAPEGDLPTEGKEGDSGK